MKILYVTPNSTDPLAFYRGTGPLSRLRRDNHEFDFVDCKDISWASVYNHDLVMMHRPHREEHLMIAKICEKWATPLVLDYDDWLLDLSESNPAFEIYRGSRQALIEIAKCADATFVATEKLKELQESIGGKNVVVVPNAYDSKLFPYRKNKQERNRIFLWRGGNSHTQDVLSIKDGFERLMKKHPQWQFVFIAQPPWWLDKSIKNIHYIAGLGIYEYFKCIWDLGPAIMAHPLTNSDFNKAKSMCSWLEATHAGAAFVGPKFKEFERPGITHYEAENPDSFFEVCDDLIMNPIKIIKNIELSEQEVFTNLELTKVNELRYNVFSQLQTSRG